MCIKKSPQNWKKLLVNRNVINYYVITGCLEEDYMIAADLTLYCNPLNNALHITGRSGQPPPRHHGPQKAPRKDGEEEEEEEEDTIAADMTKYDSPMSILDKRRNENKEEK